MTARLPVRAPPSRIADLLILHALGRWAGFVEVAQAALGGLCLGREVVGERSATLHLLHDRFEAIAFARVARVLVVDARSPGVTGLVVGGERRAVRPRAARLERHDLRRGGREQLTVVAHVQDRLLRRSQLLLEPSLRGDVEEVVGLVEQQHVVGAAQQHLERESLLLAARQGGDAVARRPARGRRRRPR